MAIMKKARRRKIIAEYEGVARKLYSRRNRGGKMHEAKHVAVDDLGNGNVVVHIGETDPTETSIEKLADWTEALRSRLVE